MFLSIRLLKIARLNTQILYLYLTQKKSTYFNNDLNFFSRILLRR
jgi:hypothetical protein